MRDLTVDAGAALRHVIRARIGRYRALVLMRLAQWPLRALLRAIVSRVPRDARVVAFGAGSSTFADNAAYLFLHMSQQERLRCVWVAGSRTVAKALRARGLDAVHRWSLRGIWVALRASLYVYNSYRADINTWLGDGARTLNLWHGVGIKPILRTRLAGAGGAIYTAPEGSFAARLFADDRHRPDFVLSTSEAMTRHFSSSFGVAPERCPELGYPRNDHLAAGTPPPPALVDADVYRRLRDCTVVGYFPTARDDSVSVPGGAPAIAHLVEIVAAQGAVVLFKAHSASHVPVEPSGSLLVLPRDADLNAYLALCDVLVTDYSSVASDFLLLNRPIVLYCPDIDAYERVRGFVLDPHRYLPGTLTRTLDELYGTLADLRSLAPSPKDAELLDFFWGQSARPGACERIAGFIEGGLNPGAPAQQHVAAANDSPTR